MVATVVTTVALAAVTNGILAAFGFNRRSDEIWPRFAPPGHTIGLVWVILFGCMGAALWLARSKPAILVLIAACLAYPFYTHISGTRATELAGNVATFAYAVWLALRVRIDSPLAATLVACVAAWIAFATVLVVALVRLNGWAM